MTPPPSLSPTDFSWTSGLERVRDILYERVQAQSWAGDRLVCIGSRLEGIPKQFFTEAEIAEFSKDDVELFDQITASRGVYPGMPDSERLDAHLTHRFVQVYHEDGKYRDYKDNRLRHEAFRWTKTSDEFKIAHEINYMQGWDFDIDVWMACNLNKKQYIRQDAVDAMNKKDGSPFAHSWAGLGHCCLGFVVGVLVCWPQEGDDEVERGPWAGDRVAIITVDKMKEIEGEWTDISEEATRLTWAIPYLQ